MSPWQRSLGLQWHSSRRPLKNRSWRSSRRDARRSARYRARHVSRPISRTLLRFAHMDRGRPTREPPRP
eukprot:15298742-Alexandrium_andersonii.AAC.1